MADESVFEPKSYGDRQRLQEAVTNILRKYADSLYRHHLARWESDNLTYQKLRPLRQQLPIQLQRNR